MISLLYSRFMSFGRKELSMRSIHFDIALPNLLAMFCITFSLSPDAVIAFSKSDLFMAQLHKSVAI